MEEFFIARWPAYTRDEVERSLPGSFEQAPTDAMTTFEIDIGLVDCELVTEHARRITQPALVVLAGGSEALHPQFAETYRSLLDWLPRAEGLVVPNATHFVQPEGSAVGLARWRRRPLMPGAA